MIRVLLADDHSMFRQGLKQLLEDVPGIEVAGEASNAWEVLSLSQQDDYDLIVLDISMPGRDGLDVLQELKREDERVLILSMYPEAQYAVRTIKSGAAGYLTKSRAADELIDAVRTIAAGRRFISAEVAEQLAMDLERGSRRTPHEKLSNREYQVLRMIASGRSVKKIADELCLSISTVSTNRSRILNKMDMSNNSELTYYAIKQGLVE